MCDTLPIVMLRACGKGERLAPLTDWWQKCVLPVAGKPLLAHWLDAFNDQRLPLSTFVVYRYRWAQVLDVMRQWQDSQKKTFLRLDGYQEQVYPDAIWADVVAFWDHMGAPNVLQTQIRRKKGEPLLLCYGDNYSPKLTEVVRDLLALRNRLNEDIWGVIGLMPTEQCSNHTEAAIMGEDPIRPKLWPLKDYHFDLPEGPRYFGWTGMGLFSDAAIEATRDCTQPQEAFQWLAREGRLLGWDTWQPYQDIGSPEAYRRVGAI